MSHDIFTIHFGGIGSEKENIWLVDKIIPKTAINGYSNNVLSHYFFSNLLLSSIILTIVFLLIKPLTILFLHVYNGFDKFTQSFTICYFFGVSFFIGVFSFIHWTLEFDNAERIITFIFSFLLLIIMLNILMIYVSNIILQTIFLDETEYKNYIKDNTENDTNDEDNINHYNFIQKRKGIVFIFIVFFLFNSFYYFTNLNPILDFSIIVFLFFILYKLNKDNFDLSISNLKNSINFILHYAYQGSELKINELLKNCSNSNNQLFDISSEEIISKKKNFFNYIFIINSINYKNKTIQITTILKNFIIFLFVCILLFNYKLFFVGVVISIIVSLPYIFVKIVKLFNRNSDNNSFVKKEKLLFIFNISSVLTILPIFLFIFFCTFIPKKINFDSSQVGSYYIDKDLNYIFKENPGNASEKPYLATINGDEIPAEYKELIKKEDRMWDRQQDVLPNNNNWHGVSLNSVLSFFVRGGSNLNNQIIKNLTGHENRDILRKMSENVSSFILSENYTPSQIYSLYFSVAPFYQISERGIIPSTNKFLNKSIKETNINEKFLAIYSLTGPNVFQVKNYLEDMKINNNLVVDTIKYKKYKDFISQENTRNITVGFNFLNSYLQTAVKKRYDDGYNYFLSPDQKNNILNSSINRAEEKKINFQKEIINYFSSNSNSPKSYIINVSLKSQNKINKGKKKFDSLIIQKNWNNYSNQNIKFYYSAIVLNYTNGEILGYVDNSERSGGLFKLQAPIGSTIKPLLLAHNIKELGKNVSDFRINGESKFNGGVCNDLKLFLAKSGDVFTYKLNGNVVDNWAKKEVTEGFDNKVHDFLFKYDLPKDYNKYNLDKDFYKIRNNKYDKNRDGGVFTYEKNYFLGQSREFSLLNLAQLYQALLNNGKLIPISSINSYFDFEANKKNLYNPYSFDPQIKRNQFFDARIAYDVKQSMTGAVDKGGTLHGTATEILFGNNHNRNYYAKTGTTSELGWRNEEDCINKSDGGDIDQFGYTVIANDSIVVLAKVFYGLTEESKIRDNKSLPNNFEYIVNVEEKEDLRGNNYKIVKRAKFFPKIPGYGGATAGYLALYILKEFE